jgi:hypothetical protein
MYAFSSRDSVVGIATAHGLHGRGGRSSSPGRVKNFLHVVQTKSGVHPASYPMRTGGSFPGIKRPGHETDHSPPASAEIKKMWIYTFTPPYAFKSWCLIS